MMNLTFEPVAITLSGAAVAAVGFYVGRRRSNLKDTGNKVQGVVVATEEIHDLDGRKSYKPIIQFNTAAHGSIT
jgi:hypothetical protein